MFFSPLRKDVLRLHAAEADRKTRSGLATDEHGFARTQKTGTAVCPNRVSSVQICDCLVQREHFDDRHAGRSTHAAHNGEWGNKKVCVDFFLFRPDEMAGYQ